MNFDKLEPPQSAYRIIFLWVLDFYSKLHFPHTNLLSLSRIHVHLYHNILICYYSRYVYKGTIQITTAVYLLTLSTFIRPAYLLNNLKDAYDNDAHFLKMVPIE